jgi:carboxymethylenebutenolidase
MFADGLRDLDVLLPFVAIMSDYDDLPHRHSKLDAEIVEAAHALLARWREEDLPQRRGREATRGGPPRPSATAREAGMASETGEDPATLGALFDAHVRAEFVDRDVDATMATMTERPYVNHVPAMTGGHGREAVRRFYADHFIGQWPADTQVRPISRTVGQGRVVDELLISFTHDREMDAILPGVAPTGRRVELPFVVVVGTEGGKVAYEHIYWDQASLLVQVGLLDPEGLPVAGVEEARRLLDPTLPSNTLMHRRQR